jgi:hypothetical protein
MDGRYVYEMVTRRERHGFCIEVQDKDGIVIHSETVVPGTYNEAKARCLKIRDDAMLKDSESITSDMFGIDSDEAKKFLDDYYGKDHHGSKLFSREVRTDRREYYDGGDSMIWDDGLSKWV